MFTFEKKKRVLPVLLQQCFVKFVQQYKAQGVLEFKAKLKVVQASFLGFIFVSKSHTICVENLHDICNSVRRLITFCCIDFVSGLVSKSITLKIYIYYLCRSIEFQHLIYFTQQLHSFCSIRRFHSYISA